MKSPLAIFVALVLVSTPMSASARTWYIKADGTGDAPTIQAGMNAAANGDTILLASGIYTGPGNRGVNFFGKTIVVKSESGPIDTVIDCEGEGCGFVLEDHEGPLCTISGVTVRNAAASGIICGYSSPAIINNILSGNSTPYMGGAICCAGGSPTISNNVISENTGEEGGGAIWCSGSGSPTITNNIMRQNSGEIGGAILCFFSTPTIENNTFTANNASDGGAVYCLGSGSPTIVGNTFDGNTAVVNGGGVYTDADADITNNTFSENNATSGGAIFCGMRSSPAIVNNTLVRNSAVSGGGVFCSYGSSPVIENSIIAFSIQGQGVWCDRASATLTCCDVFGNADGDWVNCIASQFGVNGNFSADPEFCGVLSSGNYYLQVDSPCAPSNHPDGDDCGVIGALPVGCGTVKVETKTWGAIKALYEE